MANRASQTAFGPMALVAAEQFQPEEKRLVRDVLAYQFLPVGMKPLVNLRQWLFSISEKRSPGVWGGILCRKRYIDDKLLEALSDGIGVVVNLGAGLDTRAYRLPQLSTVQVLEVDMAENIRYKQRILYKLFGAIPAHVTLVPIDFGSQDLESVLRAAGYKAEQKSFFIWEGVTQYLTESTVREVFKFLSNAAVGSRVVFTYIIKDFITGTAHKGLDDLYRQVREKEQSWFFGLEPELVAAFLADYSWKELDHVGSQEYAMRYLKPIGRTLRVTEIERAVYAVKI